MRCTMPTSQDPAALWRHHGRELRRLRIVAGLTERDAARALDWKTSTIVRVEGGDVVLPAEDVRKVLRAYQADQSNVLDHVPTAGVDRWDQFRDIVVPDTLAYFASEASSSVIRWYETTWIPGLLQTADYTRA